MESVENATRGYELFCGVVTKEISMDEEERREGWNKNSVMCDVSGSEPCIVTLFTVKPCIKATLN